MSLCCPPWREGYRSCSRRKRSVTPALATCGVGAGRRCGGGGGGERLGGWLGPADGTAEGGEACAHPDDGEGGQRGGVEALVDLEVVERPGRRVLRPEGVRLARCGAGGGDGSGGERSGRRHP